MALDPIDQQLLNALQTQIPLVPRPFGQIGDALGIPEDEVLRRIRTLKAPSGENKRGLIRQISAIFDSKSLGYQSTLVAARVDEDQLEAAAAVINRHPGVSHNYRRNHAFNLWYTLAVPPDSSLGLEKTLDILHKQSGALSTRMLPTIKLYKIGVKFDMAGDADTAPDARTAEAQANPFTQQQRETAAQSPLTTSDKEMIRVLQKDLPIEAEPFGRLAAEAGVSVESL